MIDGGSEGGRSRTPTTAPAAFDPQQFARDSEAEVRAAREKARAREKPLERSPQAVTTVKLPEAPPLNKRVRVTVPLADLAWFDLSDAALALANGVDGTKTLLELIESTSSPMALEAVAELHDAGVLAYEE